MQQPVRPHFFTLALSDHELSWLRELAAEVGIQDPADYLRSLLSHAVYEVRCREAAELRAARARRDEGAVDG